MGCVQNETCTSIIETVIGIANWGNNNEDQGAIPSCMHPRNLVAFVTGARGQIWVAGFRI